MNNYRKDFPLLVNTNVHYLDSAATSLKPQSVIDEVEDYYLHYSTNIHRGVYELAYVATDKYEHARDVVAEFINASSREIVFTRGASASLNLVALSFGMQYINEGDEIITSELEHHSSGLPWLKVAQKKNAKLVYVPLDDEGRITIENFKKVLTPKTKVVALTMSSNVMGYITDMKEIVKLSHEVGAIVSADACQYICHRPVDVKDLDVDFVSFSGHKMLGPTGIGVLYGKEKLLNEMEPLELGGDMNDEVTLDSVTYREVPYKFETGTMPIAEIIGLAKAIEYINKIGYDTIENIEKELMDYLREKVKDIEGITIYNPTCETNLFTFNIDGVHPHDAASVFDKNGVCIRAGHHCAQLITKWLGAIATLRASIYFYNTKEDIDALVDSIVEARDYFNQF